MYWPRSSWQGPELHGFWRKQPQLGAVVEQSLRTSTQRPAGRQPLTTSERALRQVLRSVPMGQLRSGSGSTQVSVSGGTP